MDIDYGTLIKELSNHSRTYSDLNADEKEFIKTVTHKCPACGNMFPLYDKRQGKIRFTCNRKCQGLMRITRKWKCVLCDRRFNKAYGLNLHIEVMHKDYDISKYLQEYLRKKKKHKTISAYCTQCGAPLRPNLARSRFDPCHCINASRKRVSLEIQLASTTDESQRKHLQNQIRGCKGVIQKLMNIGQKKHVCIIREPSKYKPIPP